MKLILACLDGSPRQEGVFAAASAIARRVGARLALFRCIELPKDIPSELFEAAATPKLQPLLQERAQKELDALAVQLPVELRGDVRIVFGSPWRSIVDAARAIDADLIVMGSHGYDAVDHVVGTTAARVVNHADRAVLVVRAHERLA